MKRIQVTGNFLIELKSQKQDITIHIGNHRFCLMFLFIPRILGIKSNKMSKKPIQNNT